MDFRWPPPPEGGPRAYGPGPTGPRSGRPSLPEPPTELVATPHGVALERLITGVGDPVTAFAHGLAAGIPEIRPLGSGIAGRRVFFHFRGHGRSETPPGPWGYADLARDLRTVADLSGATRALGVSLGAGALCRLLTESPRRFDRVVFVLPAVLDEPRPEPGRTRLAALLEAVSGGEASEVAEVISAELPAGVRNTPAGWAFARQRIDHLLRDGLAAALADLPGAVPVEDLADLAEITVPALVIGCQGDELHPPAVAERLAAALPEARLHIYDRPGIVWTQRADLRERISGFLNS